MGEVKAPEGWEACWEAGKHRFAGLRGRLARKGETLVRQGRVMALDGWEALWEAMWETGRLGGKEERPKGAK